MPRFRVLLKYREPTYELAAGKKAEPYSGGTVTVIARNAVEALEAVLDQFQETQRQSNVSWVREVVRIEIDLLAPVT